MNTPVYSICVLNCFTLGSVNIFFNFLFFVGWDEYVHVYAKHLNQTYEVIYFIYPSLRSNYKDWKRFWLTL